MLSVFVFLFSCSSSEQEGEEMLDAEMAADETDILLDEASEDLQDLGGLDSPEGTETEGGEDMMDAPMEEMQEEATSSEIGEEAMASSEESSGGTGMMEYQVKSGDTLMLIAFNLYGDYARWKDFLVHNPGLASSYDLSEGQVIMYEPPATPFVWNPQGMPHLIRRGETLGSISMDKYQTKKKWRHLYENNRPMIKDPNLIFAGFTLYYVPARDLASD